MSKSVVKSQVRYPSETHEKLTAFADKHGYSINEAVIKLVSGGILEDSIDEPDGKDEYLVIIDVLLPLLSISNTKKACMFISHLANMQSME